MTELQDDMLEIYNSLVLFSDETVKSNLPKPIKVYYEMSSRLLVFEQGGKSVRLYTPNYYCLDLEGLEKGTYLLPEDYDYMMSTLLSLISSGDLIKPRICLSPENYGFDIYSVNLNELWKGPNIIGRVRFISGKSRLFKWRIKRKYKL